MKTIRLYPKDLVLLMGYAKDRLLAQPNQCRLPDGITDLTQGEKLALAYFEAALDLIGGKGVDVAHVIVEYQTGDSDTI